MADALRMLIQVRLLENFGGGVVMADRTKLVKSWRQIASEVAQEDDPEKLSKLTAELLRALEREKQQADTCFQPATKMFIKVRAA